MASGQFAEVHVDDNMQLHASSGQIGVHHGPRRDLHPPILSPKGGLRVCPLHPQGSHHPDAAMWWLRLPSLLINWEEFGRSQVV